MEKENQLDQLIKWEHKHRAEVETDGQNPSREPRARRCPCQSQSQAGRTHETAVPARGGSPRHAPAFCSLAVSTAPACTSLPSPPGPVLRAPASGSLPPPTGKHLPCPLASQKASSPSSDRPQTLSRMHPAVPAYIHTPTPVLLYRSPEKQMSKI